MAHSIEFTPGAARALRKLERSTLQRVSTAIDALALDPRPTGARKLKDAGGAYRMRVGDYRVLYEIHDKVLIVVVIDVGHRREIYR